MVGSERLLCSAEWSLENVSDPGTAQGQKASCFCYRIKLRVEPGFYKAPSYILKPNPKTAEMRTSQLALDQVFNENSSAWPTHYSTRGVR